MHISVGKKQFQYKLWFKYECDMLNTTDKVIVCLKCLRKIVLLSTL